MQKVKKQKEQQMKKPTAVLDALLSRYWELIKQEDIGRTKGVTESLDQLETAIRECRDSDNLITA